MKYKVHHYILLSILLLIIPIIQLSFFSAWGLIGASIHLVGCVMILAYFYINPQIAWSIALVSGFMLDLHNHNFGQDMILLSVIIIILNILFSRWLVNRNLISLFFATLASFSFYYFGLYIWQSLFVNAVQIYHRIDLSWSGLLVFVFVNIVCIIICFWILRLVNKFLRYAPK